MKELKNVGERIQRRRKELGMTLEELGNMVGVNKSTIHRYENGQIRNFSVNSLAPIAKALRCTPAFLMGWEDANDLIPIEAQEVPVLGEIACGQPITVNEEHEQMTILTNGISADYALKCRGDSMINARIHDGDIVFLKQTDAYQNGDIVAVIVDGETTLKRIYLDKVNEICTLMPENPLYPAIRLQGEELDHIKVVGKAVAFQSAL